MILLAIESSCDETAVALVKDGRHVLADCIASQVDLHRLYGGVVPEIASRKHIEVIYDLADQALASAGLTRRDRRSAGGGELRQGRGSGSGGAVDSGSSHPGTHCSQLSGVSLTRAPVLLPGGLWWAHHAGPCDGLYQNGASGHDFRRCGRRVL